MLEILLLALALAADAFAVSITLGSTQKKLAPSSFFKMALLIAAYFGIAQGLMPLIGYGLGATVVNWLAGGAAWIACFILVGLGVKMLYESRSSSDDETAILIHHRALFSLAIATSLDAMAAGFTLNLLPINAYLACFLIALITGLLSFMGTYLGHKSGSWLGRWAEAIGGLVLIAIGIGMVI